MDKATGRGATLILAQKYNDPKSQFVVNSTHVRYDGGTDYYTLARPGQSPDGTKVAWHSEFLNGKNKSDIFWSLVYSPYPPTDLEADMGIDGKVQIGFLPPKYTERRWINPATGEIDEVNGEVLYAREIKEYHIWRSKNPTSGWDIIGTINAEYGNDPITNTLKSKAKGNWVSNTNKIVFVDNPQDGTWYYAITSDEHSGLESDELSQIINVIIVDHKIVSTQIVREKGQKLFWTTAPPAPRHFQVTKGNTPGHYWLRWIEPLDKKARFYNVYYSTRGKPEASQDQRIASLPLGTSTYLDWLADPDTPGLYGITTVDRYGNESSITYPDTETPGTSSKHN